MNTNQPHHNQNSLDEILAQLEQQFGADTSNKSSNSGSSHGSSKKKKGVFGSMPTSQIVGALTLVLLAVGSAVGVYLSQQDQSIQQQASCAGAPTPASNLNPTGSITGDWGGAPNQGYYDIYWTGGINTDGFFVRLEELNRPGGLCNVANSGAWCMDQTIAGNPDAGRWINPARTDGKWLFSTGTAYRLTVNSYNACISAQATESIIIVKSNSCSTGGNGCFIDANCTHMNPDAICYKTGGANTGFCRNKNCPTYTQGGLTCSCPAVPTPTRTPTSTPTLIPTAVPTVCAPLPAAGNLTVIGISGSTLAPGNRTITWNKVAGATAYGVRINDLSDGFNCTPSSMSSLDFCGDVGLTGCSGNTCSKAFNFLPNRSYTIWIHPRNVCGYGGQTTLNLSTAATATSTPVASNTPTNTPIVSTPTNTPPTGTATTTLPPTCNGITMHYGLTGEPNRVPRVGDNVTFECALINGATRYEFRVLRNSSLLATVNPISTGSRVSQPFTISQGGNYSAQCRACNDSSCQDWE